MGSQNAQKLWIVNVLAFILVLILALTGLTNWLILPRGFAAREGALGSLRHLLHDIHACTALIFLLTIAVHLLLHGKYIRAQLQKCGVGRPGGRPAG